MKIVPNPMTLTATMCMINRIVPHTSTKLQTWMTIKAVQTNLILSPAHLPSTTTIMLILALQLNVVQLKMLFR